MKFLSNKIIYLDYSSATPVDEKVQKMMTLYESKFFANPSSIHSCGVNVKNIINDARAKIASLLFVSKDEIIFTGSGTESNALAILGIVNSYYEINFNGKIPHIITTVIEHPSVLENCQFLEKTGRARITYISVDKNGIVNPKDIKDAIEENTILVSVMYANNEIGTIQPIQEIAKIIRYFRKEKIATRGQTSDSLEVRPPFTYPLFHTDAAQAMNYLSTENVEKLGVDLMSFNSSKIYGPKGIGVLYKKNSVILSPLYRGGGQEFGLRSGTENVALIAGISLALEKTYEIKEKESARLIILRDYGINKLLKLSNNYPFKIILNGDKLNRLPNNINISISGISSELLVIELDARGIEVSEKSACHSSDDNSSYVIKSIRKICKKGQEEEGSLRISLGRYTTKKDIDVLVKELGKILYKYKQLK
jgi:cysteine desulfurase